MFQNRQARRLIERMGINVEELPDVEEVIIRTKARDLVLKNAGVSEVKAQGVRMFQVVAQDVEEVLREQPKFSDADVLLVAQQAGVSKERALAALEAADGDLARAILQLTAP